MEVMTSAIEISKIKGRPEQFGAQRREYFRIKSISAKGQRLKGVACALETEQSMDSLRIKRGKGFLGIERSTDMQDISIHLKDCAFCPQSKRQSLNGFKQEHDII
jgi:hypothetical protein